MMAEISVVPMDKGPSLSKYVAEIIKIIDSSGLKYKTNPMGTVIEGPTDDVFELIKKCHKKMAEESDRVVTTIKIDDKVGKSNLMEQKIQSVKSKVSFDLQE